MEIGGQTQIVIVQKIVLVKPANKQKYYGYTSIVETKRVIRTKRAANMLIDIEIGQYTYYMYIRSG